MRFSRLSIAGSVFVWALVAGVVAVAIVAAMMSPQLQWRDPIYIGAGFAGIVAMALLLLQPLLAAQNLPGLSAYRSRRIHRWIGGCLIIAVVFHVAGLWITSPPDVLDALLFRSPTWFTIWGVIAVWALFVSGIIALLRSRFRIRVWRLAHTSLAVVIVCGSIAHALLIEGTMGIVSKAVLCLFLGLATLMAIVDLKCWSKAKRP